MTHVHSASSKRPLALDPPGRVEEQVPSGAGVESDGISLGSDRLDRFRTQPAGTKEPALQSLSRVTRRLSCFTT
jgi:hypothetical protein